MQVILILTGCQLRKAAYVISINYQISRPD
jgi:hypothetical protein